eukprot:scaffold9946_cov81-Skeletonema_marinoi.AAC.1
MGVQPCMQRYELPLLKPLERGVACLPTYVPTYLLICSVSRYGGGKRESRGNEQIFSNRKSKSKSFQHQAKLASRILLNKTLPKMQKSGPDPAVMEAINRGNKVVFFDVALGGGTEAPDGGTDEGKPLGRIKLELFVNDCPKTCENFRQFCTGEHTDPVTRAPMGYKNSGFHRVIKDFMIQAGDFINHDGTGKSTIFGTSTFADENLTAHKHDGPGMLSSANSGPNSNGCQFFITCKKAEWLDGKH